MNMRICVCIRCPSQTSYLGMICPKQPRKSRNVLELDTSSSTDVGATGSNRPIRTVDAVVVTDLELQVDAVDGLQGQESTTVGQKTSSAEGVYGGCKQTG